LQKLYTNKILRFLFENTITSHKKTKINYYNQFRINKILKIEMEENIWKVDFFEKGKMFKKIFKKYFNVHILVERVMNTN
jgi:actin-related protein